jgi:hypothetical protein
MQNIKDIISFIVNTDILFDTTIMGIASIIVFIGRRLYLRVVGGKILRKGRVLNKKRIDGSYKRYRIIKYVAGISLCLPGIIMHGKYLSSIPLFIGIALSIVNIINENKYEVLFEFKNGISYRGKYENWGKVELLYENDEYKEIRINGNELYYYKDNYL